MRNAGILLPLLDSIKTEGAPKPGILMGKKVATGRKGTSSLIAVDSQGFIHFLLFPSPDKVGKLARIKLKSLSIDKKSWIVSDRASQTYLDIYCRASAGSPFARPFLGFCEDILQDISRGGGNIEEAVYRAYQRWKKFWASGSQPPFTVEWLHGLHGELSFLSLLVKRNGIHALKTWAGPDGQDHDFQGRGVAFEVKTSSRIPLLVHISNLGQLDDSLFDSLFLACFHVGYVEGGATLPQVVRDLEKVFSKDEEALDLFHEKLEKAGYDPRNDEEYSKYRYSLSAPVFFRINNDFPRITQGSFPTALDSRITSIKYTLELRGLKEMKESDKTIKTAFLEMIGRS